MNSGLIIGGLALAGLFLVMRRKAAAQPGSNALGDYTSMLERRQAYIDADSGVVVYGDDPRGPTFGSFRDAERYNNAVGLTPATGVNPATLGQGYW